MSKFDSQLANKITLIRIFGVGLIFWLVPFKTNDIALWVITIFTIISLTDYLDGWVARRFKIESDLGKVLDPLADKILILCFLPLIKMQVIPIFPVFIIFAREFAMMAMRTVAVKHGVIIAANSWGKWKTALTFPLCGVLFAKVPVSEVAHLPWFFIPIEMARQWVFSWPDCITDTWIWLATAVTIFSFITYVWDYIWKFHLDRAQGDKALAKKSLLAWSPTGITLLNLTSGLAASLLALNNRLEIAAALILLGMFMDGLDGKLARRLGVHSESGAKWDSRADFMTFGVAPGVMGLSYFIHQPFAYSWVVGLVIGVFYYGCVHFRLKRFANSGHGDYFEGLPSPAGAAVAFIPMVSPMLVSNPWWTVLFLVGSGLLMISKIPYPHTEYALRHTRLRILKWPGLIVFFGTLFALLGVPCLKALDFPIILFAMTSTYLLFPIGAKLFRSSRA